MGFRFVKVSKWDLSGLTSVKEALESVPALKVPELE